jgi:hypothetical protein
MPSVRKPAHFKVTTDLTNTAPTHLPDVAAVEDHLGKVPDYALVWVYSMPAALSGEPEPEGTQIAHGKPVDALEQLDEWAAEQDAADAAADAAKDEVPSSGPGGSPATDEG